MVEGVDGVGDKGSGDTTTLDVEILLGACLEHFQTSDDFPQLEFLEY
jgi:hypothetical protein